MSSTLAGDYRLIASLGRGGMADVFLAARLGPERFTKLVVIKRLRADLSAQPDAERYRVLMLDEARLAARLHHPNIVQTYEVTDRDGEPSITMEYLDGKPIHQVVRTLRRNDRALPHELGLRVIAEVLSALHYAHTLPDYDGRALRIIHRDVSPQNVFWTYDGGIKLVDFGVAKYTLNSNHTEAGLVKGKLPYMAPEQARGEAIDHRVDVFAAGVVMWELMSGHRLFRGATPAAALHRLLYAPIHDLTEAVPGIDPEIARICARALARDRDRRYPDAAAMRADLDRVLGAAANRDELARFIQDLFAEERHAVSQLIKTALAGDPPVSTASVDVLSDGEDSTASIEIELEPATSPTVSVRTPSLTPAPLAAQKEPAPERRPRTSRGVVAALAGTTALVLGAIAWILYPSRGTSAGPPPAANALAVSHATTSVIREPPSVRLCGSNTIGAELAPALVDEFLRKKGASQVAREASSDADHARIVAKVGGKPVVVDIRARGTATAFEGLSAGECDLGMASRAINDVEVAKLQPALGDLRSPATEHVIALDGIAVIVHPNNRLRTLDRAALHDVFTGHTTDWAQLGGAAGPITVYARDDKSGTYDTFKHLVLGSDSLVATAKRLTASEQLADDVATDPSAIGFIGLAYVRSAKALAIGDAGVAATMPTSFTVATEDYMLSRRLYFYTPPSPKTPLVAELVSFAMSPQGQRVVRDAGFVDLTVAMHETEPCDARCPTSYAAAIAHAKRVSLDFRFREGSDEIDSRATRDLDRLTQTMRSYPDSQLLLFGFSDSSGDARTNIALSRQRARTIATELAARGLTSASVEGLGPARPIATNATAAGRERNRRVEVWLKLP